MDKRIQNDIKKNKDSNDDVDKNLDDYSNPKMLMISGHNTTISCNFFHNLKIKKIIKYFNIIYMEIK